MESWGSDPSIGFVSTYPPTICGLANFTASLLGAISENRGAGDRLGVVALADSGSTVPVGDVLYRHGRGNQDSLDVAIKHLNAFDVVSIQHEFGIFGGTDGDEAVEIAAALKVPAVVTFHTVLNHPSDHQRAIVERLALITARSVVMSRTALHRLTGTDGRLAARMERHTRRLKRGRYWPSIGQRYDRLMSTVAFGDRSAANHPIGIHRVAG